MLTDTDHTPQEAGAPTENDLRTLRLDNQLCFSLYSTTHAMTRAYRPMLSKLGLTYSQYLVLLVLWERDGQMLSQIGQALHLDSGTLTPLLKRLESAGFVERHRGRSDARELYVNLTEKGKNIRQDAIAMRESIACRLALSDVEMARIKTDLDGILERMTDKPLPSSAS